MASVPKLRVPFGPVGRHIPVVEQDSVEEIAQCVFAVLATEEGSRNEEPEFGISDPTFRQLGADLEALQGAVERWEPRADLLLEDDWEDLIERVRASVAIR